MIFVELIHNLALLAALSVLSGFIGARWNKHWAGPVLQGLLFGSIAIIGMLNPLRMGPGLIFDGRSVVLSLCALFFGPLAGVLAGGMALVCRLWQGGVGAHTGAYVIGASVLLGTVFHFVHVRRRGGIRVWNLLAMGLLVHGAMVLLMLTLPEGMGLQVAKRIAIPVMTAYPLATILIGKVLSDRMERYRTLAALAAANAELEKKIEERTGELTAANAALMEEVEERRRAEAALRRSQEDLNQAQRIANVGSWRLDVASNEVTWSNELYKMYGFDPALPVPPYTEHVKLFTPESWERLSAALARTREEGIPYELELEMVREVGRGWMWVRGEAARDAAGAIAAIRGIAQDITERKLAEIELSKAFASLEARVAELVAERMQEMERSQAAMLNLMEDLKEENETRRKAEADLRGTLNHLQSILNASPDSITITDPEWRIRMVSPSTLSLMGCAGEEMLMGKTITDFIAIEDRERVAANIARMYQGIQIGPVEYRGLRADGRFFDMEVNSEFIREEGGSIAGVVVVTRDVTERKRAEEELRRQAGLIRSLLDAVPDLIFFKDENGVYLGCNTPFTEFVGKTREEVVGRTDYDLFSREVADFFRMHDRRMMELNEARSNEEWVTYPDGRRVLLDTLKKPYRGPDGRLIGLLGVSRDITERNRAAEELRGRTKELQVKNRHLECLYELAHVIEKHGDRKKALCLGLIPLLQKAIHRPVPLHVSVELDDNSVSSLADGEESVPEGAFPICVNGRNRGGIRLARQPREPAAPLTADEANLLGAVTERLGRLVVWFDALREVQERQLHLIQADKLASLGVMVAGVAHEINNPVNNIMLNASLLRDVVTDVLPILDDQRNRVGDFLAGGLPYSEMRNHIGELMNGILEGSECIKTITGDLRDSVPSNVEMSRESAQVNDVVTTAVRMCSHMDKHFRERIVLSLADGLPRVQGSHRRLEQVVINLIQNAWQALRRPEERIYVLTTMDAQSGTVVMVVRDEGCGMSPEVLAHIKDPFFTTRRDKGGTGLGISVSNGIVEEMGGRLKFESTEGKGTVARIHLPVQKESRVNP